MEYNITNAKIERIATFDTRRDGTPLVTKAGKPYKKVLLDIDKNAIDDMQFLGKLSMLDFDNVSDTWEEGSLITGKVIHDGDYWNFELPKVNYRDRVAELEQENKELKERIEFLEREEQVISDDDLPF